MERFRMEEEARKVKAERQAKWPQIEADYTPEIWRKKYREDHAEKFYESVDILQKMKELSHEEAEETLLDILIKITFIETNLTVNGARSAVELFDNLQLAQNDEPTIPFSSPQDLKEFCDSMPLNFYKESATLYRNTGVQGRRFVQWLKKRVDLGDEINAKNFHEIKKEFIETIQVDDVNQRKFAELEPGLDYSSLWYLGKRMAGFDFDKTKNCLLLTPEATDSLPLNLPIFTDTINSSHSRKLDYSRKVSAFVTKISTKTPPERTTMFVNNEELFESTAALFRRTLDKKLPVLDRSFSLIHGCIRPNVAQNQVEVFTVEPTSFCAVNNLCTNSSGQILRAGNLHQLDFNAANLNELHQKGLVMTRPKIEPGEKRPNNQEPREEAADLDDGVAEED